MTKPVDPYTRMYWRLIDDEKFVEIYPDDHHFSLYVRLLMAADMSWPASASLPFATRKASLQKLCDVGLVDVLASGRYRIRGLDAERRKRQQKASNAAASRWEDDEQPARSANGTDEHPPSNANGMPSRAEPSRAKKEPSQAGPGESAFDAYYRLTIKPPSQAVIAWLNRLCDDHPEPTVVKVMVSEWQASSNPADFLGRVQTRLAAIARHQTQASERAAKDRGDREREEARKRAESQTPEQRERIAAFKAEAVASIGKSMP
jgi:hypothetical protein